MSYLEGQASLHRHAQPRAQRTPRQPGRSSTAAVAMARFGPPAEAPHAHGRNSNSQGGSKVESQRQNPVSPSPGLQAYFPEAISVLCLLPKFFKTYTCFYFTYLFLERGREGERERQKHQCVVVSHTPHTGDLACPPGVCPTGNPTGNPWICRPARNPLSHTSQGHTWAFIWVCTRNRRYCMCNETSVCTVWSLKNLTAQTSHLAVSTWKCMLELFFYLRIQGPPPCCSQ